VAGPGLDRERGQAPFQGLKRLRLFTNPARTEIDWHVCSDAELTVTNVVPSATARRGGLRKSKDQQRIAARRRARPSK
jgi:hypothetical protein